MAVQDEINDILETIRKELPNRAHSAYEDAVKRAMHERKRRRHRRGRGFDWSVLERTFMPPVLQQKKQSNDGLLPILTLLIGFIGGAALMYLFDPDRGTRRRASIQVEARRIREEAEEAVEGTAERVRSEVSRIAGDGEETKEQDKRDTENKASDPRDGVTRANSMGAETRNAMKPVQNAGRATATGASGQTTSAADEAVTALVRAEISRNAQNPSAIEVTARTGIVTLTGRIPASEVQELVEKVRAVPGVNSVENRMEVHDATPGTTRPPSSSIS